MAVTYTGTRGEPQLVSTGSAPTFAADADALSTFFAARSFRQFDTVAHLAAATGSGVGEWAIAQNAPGATYWFNATSGNWQLGNRPEVATSAARDALFSSTLVPVAGDEVYRSDLGFSQRYSGTAWVTSQPVSALIVPTITASTGTSAVLDTAGTGLIKLTAITSLTVDNAFLTAFRKHRISSSLVGTSAATCLMQLRTTAPATDAGAHYDYTRSIAFNGTATSATTPSLGNWPVFALANTNQTNEIDLYDVSAATQPSGFVRAGAHAIPAVQGTVQGLNEMFISHQLAGPYGGFLMTFGAVVTGTIRIIGEY